MSTSPPDPRSSRKPLRLWPGVAAAVLLVLLRFVVPIVVPDAAIVGFMGSVVLAAAIVVWWVFFSRAPWPERLGAVVMMLVAFFATRPFIDKSIAGGMMGMMFPIYAIPPSLGLGLVGWAVATRHLSDGVRRVSMAAAILLACGVWTLVRTDGIKGTGAQLHWRWTKTPEERLLAQANDEPSAVAARGPAPAATETPRPPAAARPDAAPAVATAPSAADAPEPAAPVRAVRRAEWPGFRGPDRDDVIRGVRIATDWSQTPPVQLWRRPVGPGWSSFAVSGNLIYTQEQRGDEEAVSCYRLNTGEPVWRHRDAARFWESNGGAGPRGTPTLSNGRVYAFGATGILNVLDAATGTVVWSRNVASAVRAQVPTWGFSSSPLVVDDVVIVAASGKLAAYDAATGNLRWSAPERGFSYSSPHLVKIDGVEQVVFMSGFGTISIAPATGKVLWEHAWEGGAIVQPAVTADGDLLVNTISMNGGVGIRRLAVAQKTGGWKVEERWTSSGLKPYFNDFVVHKGHAFGFDGNMLSCIDLQDGQRKWKGGRYGNGQLLLLADEDLLLVLSEDGDLALVKATPDQFTEVARFPAALDGKTWNHPVLVRDALLVRNDHEMAAFRLSLAGR